MRRTNRTIMPAAEPPAGVGSVLVSAVRGVARTRKAVDHGVVRHQASSSFSLFHAASPLVHPAGAPVSAAQPCHSIRWRTDQIGTKRQIRILMRISCPGLSRTIHHQEVADAQRPA